MPFFVADPDWQGRARDGIPGQSLIHRPVMEDSDCSSSDDDEDIEVDVNPDPSRMARPSHRDPHTAAKEYHQSQLEEIIVAIKDFDTYAARYPPEAMPKPSPYYVPGIPGEFDICPEFDRDSWSARDSTSTGFSIESQTTSNEQGAIEDIYNPTDRQLRTPHVLCGRDLTPSTSRTETSANTTSRSELYPATNSTISDFVPEWPSTTQGFSTLPSYRRRAAAAKEPSDEAKPKGGLFSAARRFFTWAWPKKSSRLDTEAPEANHLRQRSGSGSSSAASVPRVLSDPNFIEISLR